MDFRPTYGRWVIIRPTDVRCNLDFSGAGRFGGRRRIDALVESRGPEVYAAQEARARGLLEQAERQEDAAALARLLAEYPNAAVVPQALLELGRRRLAEGRPQGASDAVFRLLFVGLAASAVLAGLVSVRLPGMPANDA